VTYVYDPVKVPVPKESSILSRMTRQSFRRLAGTRFTYLIEQLQEVDPKKWSNQAIADAIGCERSLISKWHPNNVRQRREPADRSGLTDLVIQGIRDGLGISSEYLFMPSSGLPDYVLLPDGSKRPCGPDEVDHKLFGLGSEKLKLQVQQTAQEQANQARELAKMRAEMAEMRQLLKEALARR
jgi:hypothetical protein